MSSISDVTFRLATEEDAVPLERLINAAFRHDKTTQVFLSIDHEDINVTSVEQIKAKIQQPDCTIYVAVDSQRTILAHGSVCKLDASRAWFGMLAVDIAQQKQGLGGGVLKFAEDYAVREWGSTKMEFDVVNTRTELIAWYKRKGYAETGATTPFPYQYHDNWEGVLRTDLHFVIFSKDLKGR